jgi:hypothetical protein
MHDESAYNSQISINDTNRLILLLKFPVYPDRQRLMLVFVLHWLRQQSKKKGIAIFFFLYSDSRL